ncbi:uncharacterized protein LOC143360834 [Halictus rubicundus]|uniref:uncharacterized protein LOC143360834 n=1 Tax=Halictus rubicundus TaxID=77578 RepID=UPI00403572BD
MCVAGRKRPLFCRKMNATNGGALLDIELFIEEVKKYPEIWNVAAEEYHDKTKKRSAWLQVCRAMYDNFDEKHEKDKNEMCTALIKKWRNIKDNFLKSIKKKTKSGQAADRGRQYIYGRQLSFLRQDGTTTNTQSSLEDQEEEKLPERIEDIEERSIPSRPPQLYTQNTRKRKRDIESALINFMNAPVPDPKPNADRSFFESILPSLTGFSEDQKLEFRCQVLNIICRIRQQNAAACSSVNTQLNFPQHLPNFQPPLHLTNDSTPARFNFHSPTVPHQNSLRSSYISPSSAPGLCTNIHTLVTPSSTISVSPSTSSTVSETETNTCSDMYKK